MADKEMIKVICNGSEKNPDCRHGFEIPADKYTDGKGAILMEKLKGIKCEKCNGRGVDIAPEAPPAPPEDLETPPDIESVKNDQAPPESKPAPLVSDKVDMSKDGSVVTMKGALAGDENKPPPPRMITTHNVEQIKKRVKADRLKKEGNVLKQKKKETE